MTNEGIRIKTIVDHITAQNENESSDILESLVAEICSTDDIGAACADTGVGFRHPSSKTLRNQTSKGRSLTINIDSGIDEITIKMG